MNDEDHKYALFECIRNGKRNCVFLNEKIQIAIDFSKAFHFKRNTPHSLATISVHLFVYDMRSADGMHRMHRDRYGFLCTRCGALAGD